MWTIAASLALATPAATSTSTCSAPEIVVVRPADGATVGPDVVVQAAFTGSCGSPGLGLQDAAGSPVSTELTIVGQMVQLTPVAPLPPGTYQVWATDRYYDYTPWSTFTVEDGASWPAPPGPPTDVSLDAERACNGALVTHQTATATFAPDPQGWGVVVFDHASESGVQLTDRELWWGQDTVTSEADFVGGLDACVTVHVEAPDGEVLWTGDAVCAEEFDGCPADDAPSEDAEPTGCGCGSAAGAGSAWALLPLLAALRRRR